MTNRSRYPGYDVLLKWNTPSWDEPTRRVIEKRLQTSPSLRFLTAAEWAVADALCRRILPQPGERTGVPLAALLDAKLFADQGAGFREIDMPYMREAWRRGLAALDAEAKSRHDGRGFAAIDDAEKDMLITMMQEDTLTRDCWTGLDPKKFFDRRVLVDVPQLYYGRNCIK